MSSGRPTAIDVAEVTRTVDVDSGSFPVIDYGTGPAVLLLHGFPDSRYLWRYQVEPLAEAGFRVVAPDMRGFGGAPKPDSVEAYREKHARQDVNSILAALDVDRCRIVGHDWGADVAWKLAENCSDAVERLAILSLGEGLTDDVEQWERSWYFWYFQFEDAPEESLRRDDWHLFREWFREEGDFERYVEDLSRPGALTAALNWYRANVEPAPLAGTRTDATVSCPVLGVWSDGDHHLTEAQMTAMAERVSGQWRYEKITGASHWMMLDSPRELNRVLVDFLEN